VTVEQSSDLPQLLARSNVCSPSIEGTVGYAAEHEHLVALLRANKGEPWHRVATVVETAGTAQGLIEGHVSPAGPFAEAAVRQVTDDILAEAKTEVQSWALRDEMHVASILDDDYPSSLRTIYNRPPFIFWRGNWNDAVDGLGLAVVGTRSPSPDGIRLATVLANGLAQRGVTVLSGLARGIDTAAHRAALLVSGRTVAVLGHGLDIIYPPENEGLAAEIVQSGGALVSPFVPTQPPAARYTFAIRNAVMSGLSRGTVVVEAGPTSGARMQARLALEHGRPVFIPSSLSNEHEWAKAYTEKGRQGVRAVVVDDVEQILATLEQPHPGHAPTLDLEFG
jgi:DNA processing protein